MPPDPRLSPDLLKKFNQAFIDQNPPVTAIQADDANGPAISAYGRLAASFHGDVELAGAVRGDLRCTGDVIVSGVGAAQQKGPAMADALRELATSLSRIENKIDRVDEELRALGRMISRAPDGRTLINLVSSILQEVSND